MLSDDKFERVALKPAARRAENEDDWTGVWSRSAKE